MNYKFVELDISRNLYAVISFKGHTLFKTEELKKIRQSFVGFFNGFYRLINYKNMILKKETPTNL